jgi:hypothetical protein
MTIEEDNIIEFRKAAPSARLKPFDGTEKHATCKHDRVEIWRREPILECADCGVVVDPYAWIRDRVSDWHHMVSEVEYRRSEAQRELDGLKEKLRILRKEYGSEVEKRRAEHALMVLPPQRGSY